MLSASWVVWIHNSWLGQTVRGVSWMFATLETIHFIGLCILIGAMTLVDLRLLGIVRAGSVRNVLAFTHLAILGFTINLLSGIGFFASDPANYNANPLFWSKMGLVLLAGLNVVWFETVERRKILAVADGETTHPDTKVVAALSLILWSGVIILGRLLPLLGENG